jgi:glutaredoxin
VYYQYIEDGQVRFAEHLDEIPEAWHARAGRVEMSSPPPTSRAQARASVRVADPEPTRKRREPGMFSARSAAGYRALPERGDDPDERPNVDIYTMDSCGYCRAALAYMDRIGQPYTNYDIEDEPAARDAYLELTNGRAGVPVINVEGQVMQGWSQKRFDALIAAAQR